MRWTPPPHRVMPVLRSCLLAVIWTKLNRNGADVRFETFRLLVVVYVCRRILLSLRGLSRLLMGIGPVISIVSLTFRPPRVDTTAVMLVGLLICVASGQLELVIQKLGQWLAWQFMIGISSDLKCLRAVWTLRTVPVLESTSMIGTRVRVHTLVDLLKDLVVLRRMLLRLLAEKMLTFVVRVSSVAVVTAALVPPLAIVVQDRLWTDVPAMLLLQVSLWTLLLARLMMGRLRIMLTAVGMFLVVWMTLLLVSVILMPCGWGRLRAKTADLRVMMGARLATVRRMVLEMCREGPSATRPFPGV